MKLSRDGWTGLAVLAASLFLFYLTLELKDNPLVPIGPGFYPRIVLGITALLAGFLLAFSFFQKTEAEKGEGDTNYGLVFTVFLIFGLYVGVLPYLGYRISTLLFVAVLTAALEWPKDRKGWAMLAVGAVATTLITYVVFEKYLTVLLPRGRWTDF